MNRKAEKGLMLRKVEACVREDMFIKLNTWDPEEFEFYSDTTKVMKELADKYNLTLEEIDELWNYYFDLEEIFKRNK